MTDKTSIESIQKLVTECSLFADIQPDININDSLNLDSMSLIWLISEIEKQYTIKIDYRSEDLSNFKSIFSIKNHIESLLNEKKGNHEYVL